MASHMQASLVCEAVQMATIGCRNPKPGVLQPYFDGFIISAKIFIPDSREVLPSQQAGV